VLTKAKQPELCPYWTQRDRAASVWLFRWRSAREAAGASTIMGYATASKPASAPSTAREMTV
jgi:hypothetical protein